MSFKSSLCVCPPGSLCPQSYISVWLRNKPAFMLERERRVLVLLSQPYPIEPTYSIRPRALSQAQPRATYYLSPLSLFLSPAHLLCISAFCSPAALRFMSPSLSLLHLRLRWPWWTSLYVYNKTIKLQSCTHMHLQQHANTQMFSFRRMWNVVNGNMQLDHISQTAEITCFAHFIHVCLLHSEKKGLSAWMYELLFASVLINWASSNM